ncbi:MAG: Sir2 family NAD-dependent protein deacetylase [Opitutales bacterium]
MESYLEEGAKAVLQANVLYVGAGAGMGVDSGLPDFRSPEGFWKAYPPVAKLKLRFEEMANPRWFAEDPEFAWGCYGHRLNLYRETIPHEGFGILRKWGDAMSGGVFVYTSNVDGHFQRAGFDKHQVLECHGSLNHLQCLKGCGQEIWSAEHCMVEVDEDTLRAAHPLPSCPTCGELARPNVLMFGDWDWDSSRSSEQQRRHQQWLIQRADRKMVVIEIGAGKAVPTVRMNCEAIAAETGGKLIRINVRDSEIPRGNVSLPIGGLEALQRIDAILEEMR